MFPILFRINGDPVYSYGVLLAAAMIGGAFAFFLLARREGLRLTSMGTAFVAMLIAGLVGSRLLYVVVNLDDFDSIGSMFALRRGGLYSYGSFLGAALAGYLVLRRKRVRVLAVADVAAPVLAGMIAVTRVGCYLFGCDFGTPLSEGAPAWLKQLGAFPHWPEGTLPFGTGAPAWVQHVHERGLSIHATHSLPVHPTQLYEIVICGSIVGLLAAIWRRRTFRGQAFFIFVIAYGAGRFMLDFVRDDPERGAVGAVRALAALSVAALLARFAGSIVPGIGRVPRVIAVVVALVAILVAWPSSSEVFNLSVAQTMALVTGLAAAYGYAVARKAALADPKAAMAIELPPEAAASGDEGGDGDEPRPMPKKRPKKKKRPAGAEPEAS